MSGARGFSTPVPFEEDNESTDQRDRGEGGIYIIRACLRWVLFFIEIYHLGLERTPNPRFTFRFRHVL